MEYFIFCKSLKEMEDIETYLEELRAAESRRSDGSIKKPEEFLRELEEWNEPVTNPNPNYLA